MTHAAFDAAKVYEAATKAMDELVRDKGADKSRLSRLADVTDLANHVRRGTLGGHGVVYLSAVDFALLRGCWG